MSAKAVSRDEWLQARKDLLAREKELTRLTRDVSARLRGLPMVKLDKTYTFTREDGTQVTLADLFGDKKQLIVYHFMLGPDATEGCRGCTFMASHFPDPRHLASKQTAFCAVSRAPIASIRAFKARCGFGFDWCSSAGSDFNYDFHATLDEDVAPVEYNYATRDELAAKGLAWSTNGEQPGLSVFWKGEGDGQVYHTYSTYSAGLDRLLGTLTMLDMTPLGRQLGPGGPGEFKRPYEYDEL